MKYQVNTDVPHGELEPILNHYANLGWELLDILPCKRHETVDCVTLVWGKTADSRDILERPRSIPGRACRKFLLTTA